MSRRRRLEIEEQQRVVAARRRSVAGRRLRKAAQLQESAPTEVTADAATPEPTPEPEPVVEQEEPRFRSPYLEPAIPAAVAAASVTQSDGDEEAGPEPEPEASAEPEEAPVAEAGSEADEAVAPADDADATDVMAEPEADSEPQAEPDTAAEADDAATAVFLPAVDAEPEPETTAAFQPAPASDLAQTSLYSELAQDDQEPLPEFLTREPEPPAPPRRWPRVLAIVVVVIGLLYVIAQAAVADRVPRGAEALGVSIGGMSSEDAVAALQPAAAEADAASLSLSVGTVSYVTFPERLGLSIDVEGTVAAHTGFTLSPVRLWERVVGVDEIDVVLAVDEDALASESRSAASVLDTPARDAVVRVVDGVAEPMGGTQAAIVDSSDVQERILAVWPAATIEVPAEFTDPELDFEDAQVFADSLNSGPLTTDVTLTWDGGEVPVSHDDIAAAASVDIVDGVYALEVDGGSLVPGILDAYPDLVTDPVDATVSFDSDHQIVIDEGAPGLTVDGDALGDVLASAVTVDGATAEVPFMATEAQNTSESLGAADFKEIISSFDTPLTAEPVRTQNLRTAAADVENTIVLPGEQFNLHDVLSPITEEEGYQYAHVIVNGILTDGIGGGLSQMATTSYNAAYFAGYDIEAFRPHSVWFERYPAGRESTIYGTQINMVFTNDTPYAAVLNSYVEDGRLHVDIWSTPYYTVETQASDKTNVVQPGVTEVTSSSCSAKGKGQPGFTITNYRQVYLDGDEVKDESYTWTYKPDNAIKCVSASSSSSADSTDE